MGEVGDFKFMYTIKDFIDEVTFEQRPTEDNEVNHGYLELSILGQGDRKYKAPI